MYSEPVTKLYAPAAAAVVWFGLYSLAVFDWVLFYGMFIIVIEIILGWSRFWLELLGSLLFDYLSCDADVTSYCVSAELMSGYYTVGICYGEASTSTGTVLL